MSLSEYEGDLFAVAAGICNAAYIICAKQAREELGALTIVFGLTLGGAVVAGIFCLCEWTLDVPSDLSTWIILLCIAYLAQFSAAYLQAVAIRHLPAAVLALTRVLTAAVSGLLGWVIFGEVLNYLQLIGLALIVLGLFAAQTKKQDWVSACACKSPICGPPECKMTAASGNLDQTLLSEKSERS
eukprot:CAMPEP_0196657786 /NCGR_PEP_ID=MMETSP1086-20130531/25586_1 /TAXON_ID=77921 /ORGANISM="Cyanoptyche  gloeocystis , Strain SAG4.97" /LENGTH=184 /DNA_ID=CAMNT_0041991065 /DNA_START=663 /DNA_END=1217 /DNA_ORIENTATION=-